MANFDLSSLKKLVPNKDAIKPQAQGEKDDLLSKLETQRFQIELLNLIIERYKKFIEDGETRSLSELCALVKPMDTVVIELKIQVEDQFHPYSYDSHFLLATQKVMDTIFTYKKIKMPLSFWMSFDDMVRLKCADDLDRAILLCSLFRSLGSDSSKVLIAKDKSAWVSFVFSKKMFIVNIAEKNMSAYDITGDALKQFLYNMAYSFNDRECDDLAGDDQVLES